MIIAILANCQGGPIRALLKNHLQDNIEIIEVPPVFTILHDKDKLKQVFEDVKNADYIFMQPLKERFNEISLDHIKKHSTAKIVTFPSIIFNGYNPEMISLKNLKGITLRDFKSDFHDINIIQGYLDNTTPIEMKERILNPNLYSSELVDSMWYESISLYTQHEKDCDIKTSHLLEINMRHILFSAMNHPTNMLIEYIGYSLLKKLNYIGKFKPFISKLLDSTHFKTYPSLQKTLQLDNSYANYSLNSETYSISEAIGLYYEYYKTLDREILQENINIALKNPIQKLVLNRKL